MTIDACLAAYGIAVAAIAPPVLRRLAAVERLPGLGVAVWLLAAASVLTAWLAAGASLATEHTGLAARTVGVALLGGISARLLWVSLATWRTTRARRARHAQAAVLLGQPDMATGAVIIDSPEPAAYCLPHPGGGMVVLTTAARAALSPRELGAVLAHERAHLRGRHHMIIGIGHTLARAMSAVGLFHELGRQVPRLLEMRADDAAARTCGRATVAAAIAALGGRGVPAGALGVGGPTATVRVMRLAAGRSGRRRGRLALAGMSLVLMVGPYLATLPTCPHPW